MASKYRDVDKIVQSCLEAIESGEESLGSVLARYPDMEDSIRPPLEAALWIDRIKTGLDPNPEFVSASRNRLVAQIKQLSVVEEPSQGFSLRDLFTSLSRRQLAFQFAMASLLLVFLIVGAGSVALAARNAIPGENLYAAKLAHERVRLALSFTEIEDARLHAEFAQERLVEVQRLIFEGRLEMVAETVARYEIEVAQAIELARLVAQEDDTVAVNLVTQMDEVLSGQKMVLSALSESVPAEIELDIASALDLTEDSVSALEVIRSRLPGSTPPASTPTPTPTLKSPTPTPSLSATDFPSSIVGQTPTGTFEPFLGTTPKPTFTPLPPQVAEPSDPPDDEPEKTPKPIKEKPKPTNTHRPTARSTNLNRPTKEKDK